jgi:PAS domain S-box-containing protein
MDSTQIRILLVEDDLDIARATQRLLEQAGYSTEVAGTAAQATESLRAAKPHLVLMDRHLPDKDGLEVCSQIKTDPANADIFVVLLSGLYVQDRERIAGLETGADGYLTRPIGNRELLAQVEAFARVARLTRSLTQEIAARRLLEEELEKRVSLRTEELQASNQGLEHAIQELRKEIAERQRTEEVLARSQTELKAIYDHAPVMMCVVDASRRVLYANAAFITFTGGSEEGLLGGRACGVFGCVNALEDPRGCGFGTDCSSCGLRLALEDTLLSGTVHHTIEHQTTLVRNGVPRPVVLLGSTAPIFAGDRHHALLCLHDITQRKLAEESLQENQQRLNLALRSARMGIWDWDIRNDQMTWDDQMFRLYGVSEIPADYGVEIWEQGLHPDDRTRALAACQAALRGEQEFDTEFRVAAPDGTIRHLQANGLVLRDAAGTPIRMLGVNYDITERKHLERQLLQAQKMESVGQLAGGVAHDFNNILAAMMMQIGLLGQNPDVDRQTQDSLKELMVEAQRAANLTRQLLLFSRRSVMGTKLLDLNELVANVLKMLGRLIGEHVSLRFDRFEPLPPVEADPGMLEQVLMNLAVNARDAMPKGGRLTISIQPLQADAERVRGKIEVQPGPFVCLSVTDTGCGMDDATVKRIFEPFFTTKEPGKGTGLGLATVYGIVTQHRGWVEVESELGKGSTFKVFLPASSGALPGARPVAQGAMFGGHETVLLVEDEEGVRRGVRQVLGLLGYRVLEAANGEAALKLWQEHFGHIDLLFSDMVMPGGFTGLDLAEKFRAQQPGLKVIISSGYNTEMGGPDRLAAEGIVYLQKPYELAAMSGIIRECLDKK